MLTLNRVSSTVSVYSGVVLRIDAPHGNRFFLWPEEYWSWRDGDGTPRGGFMRDEFIRDFETDARSGAVSYRIVMGPADCEVRVRVIPSVDALLIEHSFDNRGAGTAQGGSPCLQIGHASGFQSWTFEQAKRTFIWTQPDGFTWISDTRRSGRDRHEAGKSFCQLYHPSDPLKCHNAFGRSPDLSASPLIGSVSLDRSQLAACVSGSPDGVAHGLLNCLHSGVRFQAAPGEKKTSAYRIYFLPADFDALLARVRADFPGLVLPPFQPGKMALCGQTPPLNSFEDIYQIERARVENASIEPTTARHLGVEKEAAKSYGITHGQCAALCDIQQGGRIVLPALFAREPGKRFFTADITLPGEEDRLVKVWLRQGSVGESADFELIPGTPRRCVVPLGRLARGEAVDVGIEAADGRPLMLQLDCLAVC